MGDRVEASMSHESCPHAETQPLGRQGDAQYERCRSCGRILIFQRGRAWVLRPGVSSA